MRSNRLGRWAGALLLALTLLLAAPAEAARKPPTLAEQVQAVFGQALEATNRGDFVSAERYWSEAIALNPTNAAAWSNRGNARVSQNHLQEALDDYAESIRLAPDSPDPYLNRGTAWEGLKDWDRAIADYRTVLELNPEDAAAWNNLGNVAVSLGDYSTGLEDFETAARLAPGFAFAQANAALARYQLGEDALALQRVKGLVRKYPDFADMRAALTAMLWADGQQGEAESNWVAAIGLDARYRNPDWVRSIRRWPPRITADLERFLSLS